MSYIDSNKRLYYRTRSCRTLSPNFSTSCNRGSGSVTLNTVGFQCLLGCNIQFKMHIHWNPGLRQIHTTITAFNWSLPQEPLTQEPSKMNTQVTAPNGGIQYHPASIRLSETEMYKAITSGYRWVSSLAPDGMECRTLIPVNGCTRRLDTAEPSAPIFQPVALSAAVMTWRRTLGLA